MIRSDWSKSYNQ